MPSHSLAWSGVMHGPQPLKDLHCNGSLRLVHCRCVSLRITFCTMYMHMPGVIHVREGLPQPYLQYMPWQLPVGVY